jgi:hypothetical protein
MKNWKKRLIKWYKYVWPKKISIKIYPEIYQEWNKTKYEQIKRVRFHMIIDIERRIDP